LLLEIHRRTIWGADGPQRKKRDATISELRRPSTPTLPSKRGAARPTGNSAMRLHCLHACAKGVMSPRGPCRKPRLSAPGVSFLRSTCRRSPRSSATGFDPLRPRMLINRHPNRWAGSLSGPGRVSSLDDLISANEQTVGNFLSERLGGFQINDQRELGGLLDRKIGRLGALQNPIYVDCCAFNEISII
jgi:hypothetical protein